MKKLFARSTAVVLSLALLLTSCGGGATATSMHLKKTEGTVAVSDSEGKTVSPRKDLGLYSGYGVETQAKSYAWIDLDKVKLTKLDAESQIEIGKEGKNLEIDVISGELFFNVTEPLDDDETMDIVTSTMIVGIRGTCGWVGEDTAALLEGTVSVTAGDQEVTVNAGEMAVLTAEGTLEVEPFTAASVPAFVREEVAEDKELAKTVLDTTGIDLAAYSTAPYKDALAGLEQEGEILYTEIVDFEADGNPELLVLHTRDKSSSGKKRYEKGQELFGVSIFRAGPEGTSKLYFGTPQLGENGTFSLVGSDGRMYLETHRQDDNSDSYTYCGSIAEKDGVEPSWGANGKDWTMIYWIKRSENMNYGTKYSINTDLYRDSGSRKPEERYEEIRSRFSTVKLLAHSPDGKTLVIDAG